MRIKRKMLPTSLSLPKDVKDKCTWLRSNTEFKLSVEVRKMINRRYNIERERLLGKKPNT